MVNRMEEYLHFKFPHLREKRSGNGERLPTARDVLRQQGDTVMLWVVITHDRRTELASFLGRFLNAVDCSDIIIQLHIFFELV